jgi:hypothetical protein
MAGKRLAFHKKSNRDKSGKCNYYETGNPADIVYAVLYEFDHAEKKRLDELEGRGYGYNDKLIDVQCNGKAFKAFIYEADPGYLDDKQAPNHEYKEMVLLGARYHGLPDQYIARIEAVVSSKNPDAGKRAEDETILVRMRHVNATEACHKKR